MLKKTTTASILAVLLLASVACSDTSADTADTTANIGADTGAVSDGGYDFGADLGGLEIKVSNIADVFSMHLQIDRENPTGEKLDDAMYDRCRQLEKEMGIVFIEENINIEEYETYIRTLITAGDDTFDIMFLGAEFAFPFIAGREGLLYNLLDFEELHFEEEWWMSNINDSYIFKGDLGEELYCAASAANLCGFDSMQILYFNEDILKSHNLDMPYQSVKDGKWTFDMMLEYMTACANLNGDDSFTFTPEGNAVYGLAAHLNSSIQFLYCAGESLVGKDAEGTIVLTAGTERFYDVFAKIDDILDTTGGRTIWSNAAGDDDPGSNIGLFENQRAAFMMTELSKTNRMRDKDYEYGVLPFPKFDTNQERYYCYNSMSYDFAIPVTAKDPKISARVGDALAYLSDETVIDVWREYTVESKGLRNEDSIEMLKLCMDNLVINPAKSYGAAKDLTALIRSSVRQGSEKMASILASKEKEAQASIDALYAGE